MLGYTTFFMVFYISAALAVEIAPRISDREIVERLSRLEEGQKRLDTQISDLRSEMNTRISDLRSEMSTRFEAMNHQFEGVNKRFDTMDKRFDDLTWMFGLFVTVVLVMLGFVTRMQWQMQKEQTQMKTSLETQKDEVAFLKRLIEKLLPPPKGAL
jgi:hypothetical protein